MAISTQEDSRCSALYGDNPQIEILQVVADVPAVGGAITAVEKLSPALETILDLMSFEIGTPSGLVK